MIVPASLFDDLQKIRAQSPLILNLTNFVSMDLVANGLLALGASPVMAHAPEELPEMVQIASAVAINIGTLDAHWIPSFELAAELSCQHDKPTVLDPVGAGASLYRTKTARSLLEKGVRHLRGNASEIAAVFGDIRDTKGTDSLLSSSAIATWASEVAASRDLTLVVSGPVDYVFSGKESGQVENGHPWMTKVTAMGCLSTAVVATFRAVNPSPLKSSLHAMATLGICGELAREISQGPGSFRTAFLDSLSSLSLTEIEKRLLPVSL